MGLYWFYWNSEPYSGPGMPGGKHMQNLHYGISKAQLGIFLNMIKYSSAWNLTNPSYTNLNAGYIDISDYTPAGETININKATGLWRD